VDFPKMAIVGFGASFLKDLLRKLVIEWFCTENALENRKKRFSP